MRCLRDRMIRLAMVVVGLAGASAAAQSAECPGGPPGWIAAQGSGCRLWNPCHQGEETITWSGACDSGVADGRGVAQWFQGGKPGGRYEGEWRDDGPNGSGTARIGSDTYNGTWINGCFRQGDRRAWWAATEAECGFR